MAAGIAEQAENGEFLPAYGVAPGAVGKERGDRPGPLCWRSVAARGPILERRARRRRVRLCTPLKIETATQVEIETFDTAVLGETVFRCRRNKEPQGPRHQDGRPCETASG